MRLQLNQIIFQIMKTLKFAKLPSLVLAALLQLAPVCKVAQSVPALLSAPMAIVLRLAAGVIAALGAVQAVSGASAVLITSSTNAVGTNGSSFSYRITENSPSADPGVWFNAVPLPPGLTINTNTGQITGIPTQIGVTVVHLTAGYIPDNLFAVPTNVTLTIRGRPVISTQPASQTAVTGGLATFSVIATGLPPPTYRWRFNGTTIVGETNATITLSNLTTNQNGGYTVVLSNLVGSVTSVVATLTVGSVAPVNITSHPQDRTVAVGDAVLLSVAATGSPPITYQWKKGGAEILDATNTTLPFASAAMADTGDYSVIVSNSAGPVSSQTAHLGVVPLPRFNSYEILDNQFVFAFTREAGAAYEILQSDIVPATNWASVTNFPAAATPSTMTVTNSVGPGPARSYLIKMTIP